MTQLMLGSEDVGKKVYEIEQEKLWLLKLKL